MALEGSGCCENRSSKCMSLFSYLISLAWGRLQSPQLCMMFLTCFPFISPHWHPILFLIVIEDLESTSSSPWHLSWRLWSIKAIFCDTAQCFMDDQATPAGWIWISHSRFSRPFASFNILLISFSFCLPITNLVETFISFPLGWPDIFITFFQWPNFLQRNHPKGTKFWP